jgi:DNA-binding transcriptional regulator YhcF (GntR family)
MPCHDLRPWGGSWGQWSFRPYDDSMARVASGHLEQLPSGSFRVEVHAGTDPLTGRRLRFRQTVRTEEQARIVLGRLLEQASAGQRPDSGVTVAELLARYMEVAELDLSTRDTYEGYIRRTILPALGSMELRKLRGPVLDVFYARLRRCGNLACTGRPFTEHRYLPALVVAPGNARPAWRQAAGAVRDAIGRGQLASGDELPSVRELAAHAGLPTSAARRVLEVLAEEGHIAAQQGRRAVVIGLPRATSSRRGNSATAGHDCARAGCVPHRCRPMSARTIRQIHSILSGALAAAVRWEWIDRNPASSARLPKARPRSPASPAPADEDVDRQHLVPAGVPPNALTKVGLPGGARDGVGLHLFRWSHRQPPKSTTTLMSSGSRCSASAMFAGGTRREISCASQARSAAASASAAR